jgi:hypothetical protein
MDESMQKKKTVFLRVELVIILRHDRDDEMKLCADRNDEGRVKKKTQPDPNKLTEKPRRCSRSYRRVMVAGGWVYGKTTPNIRLTHGQVIIKGYTLCE